MKTKRTIYFGPKELNLHSLLEWLGVHDRGDADDGYVEYMILCVQEPRKGSTKRPSLHGPKANG